MRISKCRQDKEIIQPHENNNYKLCYAPCAPEEENEGQETSGHDVQKSGQEENISIKPEAGENIVDALIPYPAENAGHNYAVDNEKPQAMKQAAAMADKPVQRTSLKERLEAFKVKAAETGKADTERAKGKEKTL